SPQAIMGTLNISEADYYFSERKSHGFNAAWVQVLCYPATGGNGDGSTIDGIFPFNEKLSGGSYNLSTPNSTYFERLDGIIAAAASHGILLLLDPIETGGWLQTLYDNGVNACFAYGVFLGERYKNSTNIIWFNGNE